jgi:hypothetical protein
MLYPSLLISWCLLALVGFVALVEGSSRARLIRSEDHDQLDVKGTIEPVNIVINCAKDHERLQRFQHHMRKEGLSFEIFPCVIPTHQLVKQAIEEGILGHRAEAALLKRSGILGSGLAHLRLWQEIYRRNLSAVNIFEDDEVVLDGYRNKRSRILAGLPAEAEYVNFNPLWPNGPPFNDNSQPSDRKLLVGQPMWAWTSNYYVSARGAHRRFEIMRGYDLGPNGDGSFDWILADYLTNTRCKSFCHVDGYLMMTNSISFHCDRQSTVAEQNKLGVALYSGLPPFCDEVFPEEQTASS